MMRSLFSGVSGLRVHQTKMDVIAHNISNVNTVGYKSSRATFMDAFYQRLQGAAGQNDETGRAGSNPMQIGLGANIGSIDNIMTQGASQRTDNAFDAMIQGSGFFIVSDASGTYFTRAGNIKLDEANNLHINGMRLMGWDTRKNTATGKWEIENGPVKELDLSGEKQYMPPTSTTIIDMIGNLNPQELPETNTVERTMSFYDSVGTKFTVDVVFEYLPDESTHLYSNWTYTFKTGVAEETVVNADGTETVTRNEGVLAYPNGDRDKPEVLLIDVFDRLEDGTEDVPDDSIDTTNMRNIGRLVFDKNGELVGTRMTATGPNGIPDDQIRMVVYPVSVLDPTGVFGDPNEASRFAVNYEDDHIGEDPATTTRTHAGVIKMDFSEFTQYDGEDITAQILYADGNEPGTLEDYSIGPSGEITGRYTNGETRLLGQIPLAQFRNPAGLEKVGNNLFVVTANSGPFDGVGNAGDIIGGALEMSNVDLSQEFTEMITTQRGFQANSRTITVSDEMLQELVNLKR